MSARDKMSTFSIKVWYGFFDEFWPPNIRRVGNTAKITKVGLLSNKDETWDPDECLIFLTNINIFLVSTSDHYNIAAMSEVCPLMLHL